MPHLVMWKVIVDPHLTFDQHQKLTTSRRPPLAHAYQVWLTAITAFITYLTDKGHTDTLTHTRLLQYINATGAQVIRFSAVK